MTKLIPSTASMNSVQKLTVSHEIVRKLFRPFIHADFHPTVNIEGKKIKPCISQTEHRWLIDHAHLFGLHPEKDLNIPPITEKNPERLVDKRMEARLAHFELKRQEKQERQRAREEKQLMRQLEEGKITEEEILEKEPFTITNIPLSLRSSSEVLEYKKERLSVINARMEQMDDMISQWKQKRREGLKKLRSNNKI